MWTWVSRYQNVSVLVFIGAKDDEGGGIVQSSSQIVTTNKPMPSFLQARCPSCRPTNSVKALKGNLLILSSLYGESKMRWIKGWLHVLLLFGTTISRHRSQIVIAETGTTNNSWWFCGWKVLRILGILFKNWTFERRTICKTFFNKIKCATSPTV